MSNKKKLAFISITSTTRELVAKSIQKIIGNEIDIYSYSVDEGLNIKLSADLVVTSGFYNLEYAKKLFPNTPIINGYRVVSNNNLEQLIQVPQGSRALIAANPREASEEIIQQLTVMGIDHLIYEAYWSNKKIDPKNYDLMITPHMPSYCPPGIPQIIDIGPRVLSFKTFAEIVAFFGLDTSYLSTFETQYLRPHIDWGRKMYHSLNTSENLRLYQETILQDIGEGIVALDADNNIILNNRFAAEIFGSTQLSLINGLHHVMKQFSNENRIVGNKDVGDETDTILFKYRGKTYHCSKSYIYINNTQHSLYTFKSLDQIQNLANTVQRKLRTKSFSTKYTFESIWGRNNAIRKTKDLAKRFAVTDQTILLTGESGTGKEMFAQSIHNASPWANNPFVAVNLAAIPHSIMESELFGYSEGAFTDAKKGGKRGVFEMASGGTIFLDEIGDAPLHIQLLLLRVLEEREIIRVGAELPTPINVRIIAATNKDLLSMVQNGTFRNDLFYRLNVLSIETVTLRVMRDEIPEFIDTYLIQRFGNTKVLEPSVLTILQYYDWPGNFRELRNVSEYMFHSSGENERITTGDIPSYIMNGISSTKQLEQMLKEDSLMHSILELLAQRPDSSIGRGQIMAQLPKDDATITEGNIKRALINLKNAELIHTGTTRQGSRITDLGLYINKKLQSTQKLN